MGQLLEGEVLFCEEVLLEGDLPVPALAQGLDKGEVLDVGVVVKAAFD